MRKPTKTSLTRNLDKEVSRIVRSLGECAKCHKTEQLETSHIFSRRYRNLRWTLMNCICLCKSCHYYFHANPIIYGEFVREYLGEVNYIQLKTQANITKKWTLQEMSELLETLKKIR